MDTGFRNCTAKVTKRPAHTHLNAAARTRICIRMDHGCVRASDVDAAGCWPLRRAQSVERKGRFQNFVEGKEPTLGPRRTCRTPFRDDGRSAFPRATCEIPTWCAQPSVTEMPHRATGLGRPPSVAPPAAGARRTIAFAAAAVLGRIDR